MTDPILKDPRKLYYTEKFAKQDQDTPALQQKMTPVPDTGEESYTGHNQLENRRALVTGGDSGIGRAAAIAFAKEGADVAIQFFPGEEADAQEVQAAIEAAGRQAILIPADLRDDHVTSQIVDTAVEGLGGLDILVLNAAQQIAHPAIEEITTKQLQDTFNVNIISMFTLVQAALPHLPAGSSVVTTTSVQAFDPSTTLLDYAASKAAIANFTVGLSKQLAEKGIRVNGVAPGPIWTPLQLDHGQPQEAIPEFGQDALMERAGQPVELAPVYVFLASNAASYVTGQIYGVTGGQPINL
ncbi:SDR family oxidoreductase [uncultured Secundilactobacillus sp.]|uniref:SDR family oxidoreductase n=1 Tax=uncultured Secundilactobacillus sp. TaxID=2813935 RepID=UPI0025828EC0|nr:SDR family oxidoreductase [uncultured Secundilactobacillus sp.]